MNVARGDLSGIKDEGIEKKSSFASELQKSPITPEFENEICELKRIEKRKESNEEVAVEVTKFDLTETFESIIGPLKPSKTQKAIQFQSNPGTAMCDVEEDSSNDSFKSHEHFTEIDNWNKITQTFYAFLQLI